MGLHLCYELQFPAHMEEGHVAALVTTLRDRALELPFDAVSDLIRLTEPAAARLPQLRGLAFEKLEDVAHLTAVFTRDELYARTIGVERFRCEGNDVYEAIHVPSDVATVAHGFAVLVGQGSEPAALGVAQMRLVNGVVSPWYWHCCCKTQYASVHGDEHLVRCHQTLVAILDAASALGFELEVHDETGYWESRDPALLVKAVTEMNALIARFAGAFTDAVRDVGSDSRAIQGEIFQHPDFERLEMRPKEEDA